MSDLQYAVLLHDVIGAFQHHTAVHTCGVAVAVEDAADEPVPQMHAALLESSSRTAVLTSCEELMMPSTR